MSAVTVRSIDDAARSILVNEEPQRFAFAFQLLGQPSLIDELPNNTPQSTLFAEQEAHRIHVENANALLPRHRKDRAPRRLMEHVVGNHDDIEAVGLNRMR